MVKAAPAKEPYARANPAPGKNEALNEKEIPFLVQLMNLNLMSFGLPTSQVKINRPSSLMGIK